MAWKRGGSPWAPAWTPACALALAAALLNGCTTVADLRVNHGDAGARSSTAVELENLRTDLFFVQLPPGSTRTSGRCTPTPDDPHGGGRCTIDFTSALAPQSVYDYFVRSAGLNGWTAEQKNAPGRALSWSTTYRNGSRPHVTLTAVNPQQASPPYAYELAGSV